MGKQNNNSVVRKVTVATPPWTSPGAHVFAIIPIYQHSAQTVAVEDTSTPQTPMALLRIYRVGWLPFSDG